MKPDAKPPRRKGKKSPPKRTFEYVLLITPRLSDRTKRVVTHVGLRTVKEFSNFRYELVVNSRLEGRTLRLDILGIRPPQLTLPDVGPATFETEIDGLRGSVDVIVGRLQKGESVFRVNISQEKVVVEEKPDSKFVDVVTSAEDW